MSKGNTGIEITGEGVGCWLFIALFIGGGVLVSFIEAVTPVMLGIIVVGGVTVFLGNQALGLWKRSLRIKEDQQKIDREQQIIDQRKIAAYLKAGDFEALEEFSPLAADKNDLA